MGVRRVVILKGKSVTSEVTHTGNGHGGCCGCFQQGGMQTSRGSAMLVGFSSSINSWSQGKVGALIRSKLAQALVPGATYEPSHDQTGEKTFFIPYGGVPGDQVVTLLRMLKNWCNGSTARAIAEVEKAFPGISQEDSAVIAAYLNSGYPSDDSTVTFMHNKVKRDELTGFIKDVFTRQNSATSNYMGSLFKLLRGEINPGVQPNFKGNGYVKAEYVINDTRGKKWYVDGTYPTSCHPVIHDSTEGPRINPYDWQNNLKKLKQWLEETGVDITKISEGKPQESAPAEAQESALAGIGISAPTENGESQPREANGQFARKTSTTTQVSASMQSPQQVFPPSAQASSSASSQRELSRPSRIPNRYSEEHKEQLRANRRRYVAGLASEEEYRMIINRVKGHYQ